MTPSKRTSISPIATETLQAFDNVNGLHHGFRPAHAKGILLTGSFTPSAAALSLTRAPHISRPSTPISVRFSDFAGFPTVADGSADASPRGIAIRFHLAEHSHTDIIGHSVNAFPTRTVEEFIEFLRAVYASASSQAHPSPIEAFLGAHPAALAFVQAPKPIPVSYAKESFFGVNAYKFINRDGVTVHGRYRVRPDGAAQYLDEAAAASQTPDFLIDEIQARVSKAPVRMNIFVQIAAAGDVVDDATIQWPDDRREIAFGSIDIRAVAPNNAEEQRQIIFDPIPRVDGIESSGDPLLDPRADVYLASGRRRRAAQVDPSK